jgi:hypothetical protein
MVETKNSPFYTHYRGNPGKKHDWMIKELGNNSHMVSQHLPTNNSGITPQGRCLSQGEIQHTAPSPNYQF